MQSGIVSFVKQCVCISLIKYWNKYRNIAGIFSVEKANHAKKHFRIIEYQDNEIMYINTGLR